MEKKSVVKSLGILAVSLPIIFSNQGYSFAKKEEVIVIEKKVVYEPENQIKQVIEDAIKLDERIQEPKGLVSLVINGEENIRGKIREKVKQELGCYLFGNFLDDIEKKVKTNMKDSHYDFEFIVPDNFLVKEMDFSMEILKTKKPKLNIYQKYNSEKILLLETFVGVGGVNKVHSTGKWKNFKTPSGQFYLKRIIKNPRWFPPSWAKQKKPSEPGKNNPYGLWMSELSRDSKPGNYNFSITGDSKIRIHSTNKPKSIEKGYVSHGCIRGYPDIVEEFFIAILHYVPHKEGRKNYRGIIHPLEKAIPIEIK